MAPTREIIDVQFFMTDQGRIPVKEWLKEMMILLHGFIKKSLKTPLNDLRTAKQRMAHFEKEKSNE